MRLICLTVLLTALGLTGCGGGSVSHDGGSDPFDGGGPDAHDGGGADPYRDLATALIDRADALRGPPLDELRRVAAMHEINGDHAAYLAEVTLADEPRMRIEALALYFEACRELARGVVESDLDTALASLRGRALAADGLAWEPATLARWQGEGLLSFDLTHLALIAYVVANPGLTGADLDRVADDLRVLLPSPPDDPAAFLDEVARSVEVLAREARRGMRWVKGEIIVAHEGFPLFDNLSYPGKPDLVADYGFTPITLLTSWWFFPYNSTEMRYEEMDLVHEDIIRRRVDENLTGQEATFMVLDIENWLLDGPDQEASLDKLAQVADVIHDENPSILLGYYRLLPRRDPNAAYAGPGSDRYTEWEDHNRWVAETLGPRVDALFPSLYTIHEGADRWTIYATENVRQARMFASVRDPEVADRGPGYARRVFPYVWPQYHPNGGLNPLGYQFIDGAFWQMQLDLLYDQADGIVVWGHDGDTAWDPAWETAPEGSWWQSTVSFIDRIRR